MPKNLNRKFLVFTQKIGTNMLLQNLLQAYDFEKWKNSNLQFMMLT